MERTNISLTKPQVEQLSKQADQTGLSKSEIIRRAIDRYFLNDPEDRFILPPDEAAAVAQGAADIEAGRTHTNEEVNAYFDQKMAEWDNHKNKQSNEHSRKKKNAN